MRELRRGCRPDSAVVLPTLGVQRRLGQLVAATTGVTDVPYGALSASAFIELDRQLGAHIRSVPFQAKVRRPQYSLPSLQPSSASEHRSASVHR
jgi:hypothetical protein